MSRRGLDRDSRSRRQKSISLDVMDNLDGFQKLVSMRSAKTVLFGWDQDLSRFVEIFVIISDFVDFSIFFLISTEK